MSASDLVGTLRAAAIASALVPRVLIDGRSGCGKTTVASLLTESWPQAQLVRLDDIYPGWDGLEAGNEHLREHVLEGSAPRWQRWDWIADAPAEWHELDPSRPIIVEGSGCLSRAARSRASFAIWVELDAVTRKLRALARDGDAYRPYWDRWAAQEARVVSREQPSTLADVVVDGRSILGT